jgi:hypothetical protein
MSRHLVSIGVALIDAGARPDIARWIVELLGSVPRTYLPQPEVQVERRYTLVRFHVGDKGLILAVVQPGFACWCRLHPDGSQDRGQLGPVPARRMERLFDWLLEESVVRV